MKQSNLILCAFRYALGRSTYIVQDMIEHLMENWDEISPSHQKTIKEEVEHAIEHDLAGMQIDKISWIHFLEAVEYREKRKKLDDTMDRF